MSVLDMVSKVSNNLELSSVLILVHPSLDDTESSDGGTPVLGLRGM